MTTNNQVDLLRLRPNQLSELIVKTQDPAYWRARSESDMAAASNYYTALTARNQKVGTMPWAWTLFLVLSSGLWLLTIIVYRDIIGQSWPINFKWLDDLALITFILTMSQFPLADVYAKLKRTWYRTDDCLQAVTYFVPLATSYSDCTQALNLINSSVAARQYRDTLVTNGRQLRVIDLLIMEQLRAVESIRENSITQEAVRAKICHMVHSLSEPATQQTTADART